MYVPTSKPLPPPKQPPEGVTYHNPAPSSNVRYGGTARASAAPSAATTAMNTPGFLSQGNQNWVNAGMPAAQPAYNPGPKMLPDARVRARPSAVRFGAKTPAALPPPAPVQAAYQTYNPVYGSGGGRPAITNYGQPSGGANYNPQGGTDWLALLSQMIYGNNAPTSSSWVGAGLPAPQMAANQNSGGGFQSYLNAGGNTSNPWMAGAPSGVDPITNGRTPQPWSPGPKMGQSYYSPDSNWMSNMDYTNMDPNRGFFYQTPRDLNMSNQLYQASGQNPNFAVGSQYNNPWSQTFPILPGYYENGPTYAQDWYQNAGYGIPQSDWGAYQPQIPNNYGPYGGFPRNRIPASGPGSKIAGGAAPPQYGVKNAVYSPYTK